jgi:hypothetical protein
LTPSLSGYASVSLSTVFFGSNCVSLRRRQVDPRGFDAVRGEFAPAALAEPAKRLNRGEHVKYLRHQSEHCFLVPVVDPRNARRRLYLAFDACTEAIMDGWIDGINQLYRRVAKCAGEVRPEDHMLQHSAFVRAFMSEQRLLTDYTHSYREIVQRDRLAEEQVRTLRTLAPNARELAWD